MDEKLNIPKIQRQGALAIALGVASNLSSAGDVDELEALQEHVRVCLEAARSVGVVQDRDEDDLPSLDDIELTGEFNIESVFDLIDDSDIAGVTVSEIALKFSVSFEDARDVCAVLSKEGRISKSGDFRSTELRGKKGPKEPVYQSV